MKEVENLCVVAMEECAELQQALSKSLRFGFRNYNPETPEKDNAIDILNEYYQLMGVMEMLIDSGEIGHFKAEDIEYVKQSKRCKVSDYKELSKVIGAVEEGRMSISEQVKELRKAAKWFGSACFPEGVKLANEAADTIESLSAKLADMERPAERCGDEWIYCGDGQNMPQPGRRYLVTALWKDGDFKTRSVCDAVYGSDGKWHGENYIPVSYEVVAWQFLPEPCKTDMENQHEDTHIRALRAICDAFFFKNLKEGNISPKPACCEFAENQMSDRAWANYRKEQRANMRRKKR